LTRTLLALIALGAVACGPSASAPAPAASQPTPAAKPPATTAPIASAVTTAAAPVSVTTREEFDQVIVPAAKKEGQFNWYTCTTAEEAESRIKLFNATYPEIKVSYVYLQTNEAVEKIAAEVAAGRVVADEWQCGGQSGRQLIWRGLSQPFLPPSAAAPAGTYHWNVAEPTGFPIWFVGLGGLAVNTTLVPESKYPKTWWDLIRDPYWTEIVKSGQYGYPDPRRPGYSNHLTNGFMSVKKADYGEEWVQQFAAFKPKLAAPTVASDIARGELKAGGPLSPSWDLVEQNAPIKLLCPEPGCVVTIFYPIIVKGAPHPNAARVFNEFWLTKPAQEHLAAWGNSPARTDVKPNPERDYKTHPGIGFPDEAWELSTAEILKWTAASKLFDY
jgi:iron(III) transport system substrate-binding protein